MKDTWRNIPGYNGKYQANYEGDIRRVYPSGKTRLLKPHPKKNSSNNYLVVKLTKNGKAKQEKLISIMVRTFMEPIPSGCIPYHINGCQSDNYIQNIGYMTRTELGKRTGAKAGRQPVAKINSDGEIVEVYPSAREAARKNYMSYQTVMDRCNGKCKSAFAPDGYAYAWEDKEVSVRNALRKIEMEKGYMPKAPVVKFDF